MDMCHDSHKYQQFILNVYIIIMDTIDVLGKTQSLAEWADPLQSYRFGEPCLSYRYRDALSPRYPLGEPTLTGGLTRVLQPLPPREEQGKILSQRTAAVG